MNMQQIKISRKETIIIITFLHYSLLLLMYTFSNSFKSFFIIITFKCIADITVIL